MEKLGLSLEIWMQFLGLFIVDLEDPSRGHMTLAAVAGEIFAKYAEAAMENRIK